MAKKGRTDDARSTSSVLAVGKLVSTGESQEPPNQKRKSDMNKRCEDILFKDFFRGFIGICMSYGGYDEFS